MDVGDRWSGIEYDDAISRIFRNLSRRKKSRKKDRLPIELQPVMGAAHKALALGKNKDAYEKALKVIERVPNHPEPWHTIASIWKDQENYENYITCEVMAGSMSKKGHEWWIALAQEAREWNLLDKAILCLSKAGKVGRRQAVYEKVLWDKAVLWTKIGNISNAIASYRLLLSHFPTNLQATQELSEIYRERGEAEKAVNILSRLLNSSTVKSIRKNEKEYTSLFTTMIKYLLEYGQYARAFKEIVALKPKLKGQIKSWLQFEVRSAICLLYSGKVEEAEKLLKEFEGVDMGIKLYLELADGYLQAECPRKAIRTLDTYQSPASWCRKGDAHVQLSNQFPAGSEDQSMHLYTAEQFYQDVLSTTVRIEASLAERTKMRLFDLYVDGFGDLEKGKIVLAREYTKVVPTQKIIGKLPNNFNLPFRPKKSHKQVRQRRAQNEEERKEIVGSLTDLKDKKFGIKLKSMDTASIMVLLKRKLLVVANQSKPYFVQKKYSSFRDFVEIHVVEFYQMCSDDAQKIKMHGRRRSKMRKRYFGVRNIRELLQNDEIIDLVMRLCQVWIYFGSYENTEILYRITMRGEEGDEHRRRGIKVEKMKALKYILAGLYFKSENWEEAYNSMKEIMHTEYDKLVTVRRFQTVLERNGYVMKGSRLVERLVKLSREDKEKNGRYILELNAYLSFSKSTYDKAIAVHLDLLKKDPTHPFFNFMLATCVLHHAMKRSCLHRNHWVVRAFAFFFAYRDYCEDPMEANYNIARAFHHVNLLAQAVHFYNIVLGMETPAGQPGLRCEAAHNLSRIYATSGENNLAAKVIREYVVV